MTRGKEQPLCVQVGREGAGSFARPDVCGHAIRFDSAVIEAADVEQQATVAQMTGRPAASARTYADVIAVGPRITQSRDHVVGVVRLHDYIGKAFRQKAIPYGCPTGRFVTVCAAKEGLLGGNRNHSAPRLLARAISACIAKEPRPSTISHF
jgi:hypothetical protein